MLLKNWVLSPKSAYCVIPDHVWVKLENLPYEVELTTDLIQFVASWLFLLLGILLSVLSLAVPAEFDAFVALLGGGVLFIGFGAYRLYKSFMYSRRILFFPDEVRIRFGGNKVTTVPYAEFIALRSSVIVSQWDRHVYTHQICELVHPIKRLIVPICITTLSDNVEPLVQEWAKKHNLPIWRSTGKGYAVQQPEDIDRSLADKLYASDVPVVSVMSAPPPGINVTSKEIEGEEVIHIRIDKTNKSYWWSRGIMFGIALAIHMWLFWMSIVLGIAVLVFSLPLWIIVFVTDFRKFEELEFSSGVMSTRGNQNSTVEDDLPELKVPLGSATELLLPAVGIGPRELTLICRDKIYRFGKIATPKGQTWLRAFILNYIHERYVPDTN